MCLGIRNKGKIFSFCHTNKFVHMEMICIEEQASVVFVKEKKGGITISIPFFPFSSKRNHCHTRKEENARIAILE